MSVKVLSLPEFDAVTEGPSFHECLDSNPENLLRTSFLGDHQVNHFQVSESGSL